MIASLRNASCPNCPSYFYQFWHWEYLQHAVTSIDNYYHFHVPTLLITMTSLSSSKTCFKLKISTFIFSITSLARLLSSFEAVVCAAMGGMILNCVLNSSIDADRVIFKILIKESDFNKSYLCAWCLDWYVSKWRHYIFGKVMDTIVYTMDMDIEDSGAMVPCLVLVHGVQPLVTSKYGVNS